MNLDAKSFKNISKLNPETKKGVIYPYQVRLLLGVQTFEDLLVCWILKVKCRADATVPGVSGKTCFTLVATQSLYL